MLKQYLTMLDQSLDQKKQMLDQMIEMTATQKASLDKDPVDWTGFDGLVEKKAEMIERLDRMDDGFESVYERIREELLKDKDQHKDFVISIQKKIQAVSDASAALMAAERRNKELVETKMSEERKKLQQNKTTSKVASNYYRNMNKVNLIDPQLMDKKN
ncbi:MAG: hypothetical protein K2J95_10750 [Lachnospiraceae bacterium]|nr:hypothetical protein [Lachnospiraceae bacterium]